MSPLHTGMNRMDLADKELIGEFVVESQEGLADVETQMLEIESAGANIDTDLVNAVFRTMHSIKGSAGFLGLDRIGSLAHGLEEVLDNMRNLEVIPTSELVTTVLRSADFMTSLIDEVESSHEADVAPYIAELQLLRPGATDNAGNTPAEPKAEIAPPVVAPVVAPPVVAVEQEVVAVEPVELDDTVQEFLVDCMENLDQMDSDLVALEQNPQSEELLRSVYGVLDMVRGGAGFLEADRIEKLAHVAGDLLTDLRNDKRQWDTSIAAALLLTLEKCREGIQLVQTQGTDSNFDIQGVVTQLQGLDEKIAVEAQPVEAQPVQTEPVQTEPVEAVEPAPAAKAAPTAKATSAPEKKEHISPADSTIRVDVSLLDKLMTRVGELVLARNQILQHTTHQDSPAFESNHD